MAPLSICLLNLSFIARVGVTTTLAPLARARRGGLLGALFGATFFGLLLPWLRVIGWDAWAVVVVVSLGFTALFGAGAAVLLRLPGWPLWVACWWVAVEAARSRLPVGGFPWGRVGQSQVDSPTAGWATVGGTPVVGFVVVLIGSLLAWCIVLAYRRQLGISLAAGAGAVLLLVTGLFVSPTASNGDQVTVAVIQGNVPERFVPRVFARVHQGRTTQVWDSIVTHPASGKTLALFRCTQMVLWPK